MKRALLIKPKDNYSYAVIPNLGLGYLAAALRKGGYDAKIIDCNKIPVIPKDFDAYLKVNNFHLIGFQLYTSSLSNAKEMAKIASRSSKGAIIVVGGPHPSGDPEHALRYIPEADCAVIGEGESAIVELMGLSKNDVKDASILSKIKNLAYRSGKGEVIINEKVFIEDLEKVPMPAWDLIDPATYNISPHGTFSRTYPVAPIITSRGCPYLCTFCAAFQIAGRKIRRRGVKGVLDEMTYLYKEYGVREFHIEDDNFTIQKEYVMELSNGILERDLDIWWACPNGVRADKIDKEMLHMMERSGCYSIAFGIESGSNRVLKKMRKNLSVEEIEKKVLLVKEHTGINITGFFLIGYPTETIKDIQKTLDFSKKLRIDKASFSPVMPLPGSELYYDWRKKIGSESIEWHKFLYYQIVPFVSDIDEKILKRYVKKAVIGFYIRPRILLNLLGEIKSFYQFKILLKRAKAILFPKA